MWAHLCVITVSVHPWVNLGPCGALMCKPLWGKCACCMHMHVVTRGGAWWLELVFLISFIHLLEIMTTTGG